MQSVGHDIRLLPHLYNHVCLSGEATVTQATVQSRSGVHHPGQELWFLLRLQGSSLTRLQVKILSFYAARQGPQFGVGEPFFVLCLSSYGGCRTC